MTPPPNLTPLKFISKVNEKKEKKRNYLVKGRTVIINTFHPFIQSILLKNPEYFRETTLREENSYTNRYKTFHNWKLNFISAEEMARAGFYFTGKQDRVRCFDCSQEFDYWCYGEDPYILHKNRTPTCQFFKNQNADDGYDVFNMYEADPISMQMNSFATDLEIEGFLYSTGAMQTLEIPKYQTHASFEARLETFNSCLKHLKQNIHTLSEAGFLYTGDGLNDLMVCFYCGRYFLEWEDNDEPWTEHARVLPTCTFIMLSKGKDFVDQCVGRFSKNNQEELSKLATDHEDASMPKNEMKDDSMINQIDNQETNEKSPIKASTPAESRQLSQQNHNTIPDSFACKICFNSEIMVSFLPCGHAIACLECAMALDKCALCRKPYTAVVKVQVHLDESKDEDVDQSPCSSSLSSKINCNNCHKKDIDAVFIPCGHIFYCMECATEVKDCPVCSKSFIACMNVYL